jgi:hypothetical protein
MKKVVLLLAVVAAGFVAVKVATVYRTQLALAQRVEYRLEFVEDTALASVQQDVIHDAGKLGVALTPAQVEVTCADAREESYAQRLAGRAGLQFTNQRVSIRVRYDARVLGWGWAQEIARSKIKQVAVRPAAPQREVERVLDSAL